MKAGDYCLYSVHPGKPCGRPAVTVYFDRHGVPVSVLCGLHERAEARHYAEQRGMRRFVLV